MAVSAAAGGGSGGGLAGGNSVVLGTGLSEKKAESVVWVCSYILPEVVCWSSESDPVVRSLVVGGGWFCLPRLCFWVLMSMSWFEVPTFVVGGGSEGCGVGLVRGWEGPKVLA